MPKFKISHSQASTTAYLSLHLQTLQTELSTCECTWRGETRLSKIWRRNKTIRTIRCPTGHFTKTHQGGDDVPRSAVAKIPIAPTPTKVSPLKMCAREKPRLQLSHQVRSNIAKQKSPLPADCMNDLHSIWEKSGKPGALVKYSISTSVVLYRGTVLRCSRMLKKAFVTKSTIVADPKANRLGRIIEL